MSYEDDTILSGHPRVAKVERVGKGQSFVKALKALEPLILITKNGPHSKNVDWNAQIAYCSLGAGSLLFASPKLQMETRAFGDVFDDAGLAHVRHGAPLRAARSLGVASAAYSADPVPTRHRGILDSVRVVICEEGKKNAAPLTDDEGYALASLYQRARAVGRDGEISVKNPRRHLGGMRA